MMLKLWEAAARAAGDARTSHFLARLGERLFSATLEVAMAGLFVRLRYASNVSATRESL